jgi:hypothetical protein
MQRSASWFKCQLKLALLVSSQFSIMCHVWVRPTILDNMESSPGNSTRLGFVFSKWLTDCTFYHFCLKFMLYLLVCTVSLPVFVLMIFSCLDRSVLTCHYLHLSHFDVSFLAWCVSAMLLFGPEIVMCLYTWHNIFMFFTSLCGYYTPFCKNISRELHSECLFLRGCRLHHVWLENYCWSWRIGAFAWNCCVLIFHLPVYTHYHFFIFPFRMSLCVLIYKQVAKIGDNLNG